MAQPSQDAAKLPASSDNTVRIEVQINGEKFEHEIRTDLFIQNATVSRRGDHVYWSLGGIVRIIFRRHGARETIAHTLHMLDDEDKAYLAEVLSSDLERSGYRPRR